MSDELSHDSIAGLFPSEVVTVEVDPREVAEPPFPEEAACVRGAVPERRLQFAAGRWCAHRAMSQLRVPARPLLMGADRAPIWPHGIVGSISHTRGLCAAAVALRTCIRAIGLDVEPSELLEPRYWEAVLTIAERRHLEHREETQRGVLARMIFSAKETTYKCQRALGGDWLEFHDVEIELRAGGFAARLLRASGKTLPAGTELQGAVHLGRHFIATGMALRAREIP